MIALRKIADRKERNAPIQDDGIDNNTADGDCGDTDAPSKIHANNPIIDRGKHLFASLTSPRSLVCIAVYAFATMARVYQQVSTRPVDSLHNLPTVKRRYIPPIVVPLCNGVDVYKNAGEVRDLPCPRLPFLPEPFLITQPVSIKLCSPTHAHTHTPLTVSIGARGSIGLLTQQHRLGRLAMARCHKRTRSIALVRLLVFIMVAP